MPTVNSADSTVMGNDVFSPNVTSLTGAVAAITATATTGQTHWWNRDCLHGCPGGLELNGCGVDVLLYGAQCCVTKRCFRNVFWIGLCCEPCGVLYRELFGKLTNLM